MLNKVIGGSDSPFKQPFYVKRHGAEKRGPIRHYCSRVYPTYLEPLKPERINLLEIGVLGGGSLRMWRDYFPNAQIYGLDIDPGRMIEGEERIKTFLGDQSDVIILDKITSSIDALHIVIDDGSHVSPHQRTSFERLFPRMPGGALYFIEDLQLSYNPRWGTVEGFPGGGPDTIMDYLKGIIDGTVKGITHVDYIHFYSNIVVIRKKEN